MYEILRLKRHEIAKEKDIPAFYIFSDGTLIELASYLPTNKDDFLKIKGIGEKKYILYGDIFINIIKEYISENNIELSTAKRSKMIKSKVSIEGLKTDEITYLLYSKGLNLAEMASERDLSENTIIRHLCKLQRHGEKIEWNRFINNPEKEKLILSAIDEVGTEKLKPIKELLPEDISYKDIRLTICKYDYK